MTRNKNQWSEFLRVHTEGPHEPYGIVTVISQMKVDHDDCEPFAEALADALNEQKFEVELSMIALHIFTFHFPNKLKG